MRGKNPPKAVGLFTFLIHLPIAILCLKGYHIRVRNQNNFLGNFQKETLSLIL